MITGYLIIDLQKTSLSDSAELVYFKTKEESIYEKIESNIGKAILLTNIVIGDIERPNAFTHIVKVENAGDEERIYLDYKCLYEGTLYNYIEIGPYDEIQKSCGITLKE